jgi:uncharacterized protein
LTREAGPAGTVTHRVDVTTSTGAMNRWLAIDLGRTPAYPDRKHADDSLLTFTSGPLPADVHVLGFPVVTMCLTTSGTDGAVYVYLEAIGPDGDVSYLTEGCLRFLHRGSTGPAEPVRLGVPRAGRPGGAGWSAFRELWCFWFLSTRRVRAQALVHAPAAFRRRDVLVADYE